VSSAISGIDLALWDLVARRRGVPVHALLGPQVHVALPAYASLTWLGDVDHVCADARRALDAGFRAVKPHEADPDLVLEVRRRLGPEVTLMLDASARFDEKGAVDAAARLELAGLAWFEEPIAPQTDHAALARLRARCSMPVAAGENEFSLAGFARLVAAGAVDVVQPEIAKFGGLTPARAVGALVAHAGLVLAPHNYSLGPSFVANVHWAATAPAARWLEVPWLPEGQSFPSGLGVPRLVDGCVPVPSAPGLSAPAV
jgi:L-alanine-DL-glutamate epimerase-like enolase superfamily enzyme